MYIQGQQNKKVSLLDFSKFLKQKKRQENFKCLTSDGMKVTFALPNGQFVYSYMRWPAFRKIPLNSTYQRENESEFIDFVMIYIALNES